MLPLKLTMQMGDQGTSNKIKQKKKDNEKVLFINR